MTWVTITSIEGEAITCRKEDVVAFEVGFDGGWYVGVRHYRTVRVREMEYERIQKEVMYP